jgi:hypothetical protein
MKKKHFTPESIYDELLDYVVNQNFPDDELNEIGSHVSITDIAGIEIRSVKASGSNFIVDGSATLEVETDMGEGDTSSSSYPMTFSYEVDGDGKIVEQHSRHIDTSSFFGSSDELDEYLIGSISSEHVPAFRTRLMDILTLLHDPIGPSRECLHRLLYVNVVTVIECYLSDFFISRLRADPKLLRKMIETTPFFREQKITVSDVFQTMEAIEKRANSYLAGIVWHRLDRVIPLYEKVLGVSFPSDVKALRDAIAVRHDLVHRNGQKPDGTEHKITEADIRSVIRMAEELVDHIEKRWLDVSSPF